jgi:hypothetical protein
MFPKEIMSNNSWHFEKKNQLNNYLVILYPQAKEIFT